MHREIPPIAKSIFETKISVSFKSLGVTFLKRKVFRNLFKENIYQFYLFYLLLSACETSRTVENSGENLCSASSKLFTFGITMGQNVTDGN